ncbi:probable ribonuclease ZC3H12B [Caerostris extrusa]|uniref:Probable ribonuclease ZC3H12B n=1 Tax=Caerostris extrusa TaxID=172846 RepID=A0AAV4Q1Q9_CAEEX|nr:probable ribonuclease ZC3H12B [Caerostris extrusa]
MVESLHEKEEITKSVPLNSEENTNVIPLNAIQKKYMVESLHEKDDIIILDKVEPIVIDGNNVARIHGRRTTFSCKGIKIAVDFFLKRGHKVTAFAPEFRRFEKSASIPTTDQSLLDQLQKDGHLVFTPSRKVQNKFIVDMASRTGGVILSNGNFKHVVQKNEEFRQAVEERLLMYCFVGDEFMIPLDPLGKCGPKLKEFLSFPPSKAPSI